VVTGAGAAAVVGGSVAGGAVVVVVGAAVVGGGGGATVDGSPRPAHAANPTSSTTPQAFLARKWRSGRHFRARKEGAAAEIVPRHLGARPLRSLRDIPIGVLQPHV